MDEVVALVENYVPECQQNLRDNHRNLERVAEYCDTNYFRSQNKFLALEETKNYTTQSLASVAYQITSLAFNILHLLDLQATQVSGLESHINHLSQAEQIHREKVARREIGLFTTNKRPNRLPKIIYPTNPERPIKYMRKSIDYSILDDVGHGIQGGAGAGGGTPSPQVDVARSSKEYRAISIAPPQVPSNYAPNYPITHLNSAPNMMQPPQSQQIQQRPQHQNFNQHNQEYRSVQSGGISQPPAGPAFNVYSTGTIRYGQSPLPPPPTFERAGQEPDWVPKNYIEKVIALYDYTKEKPDELNLCENAIIYVTKKNDDGWYEGVLDGQEGLFPCNYVEPLQEY